MIVWSELSYFAITDSACISILPIGTSKCVLNKREFAIAVLVFILIFLIFKGFARDSKCKHSN